MEQRGVLDKLKKTRQACRQIFTYAVITGRAEHNPVVDLAGDLKAPKQKHLPHLIVEQISGFLNALNNYSGSLLTRHATKLLMLTGTCTIELRAAAWSEVDLDKGIWQVPAERMKMRRPHLHTSIRTVSEELITKLNIWMAAVKCFNGMRTTWTVWSVAKMWFMGSLEKVRNWTNRQW